MSDTSLVFGLSAEDNTGPGMRHARQTVETETAGMADAAESNGSKMGTALAGAAGAAGALAGAALMSTFSQAMDVSEATTRLEAQLANTTADVSAATDAMTNVFTDGWGESATEVGDAIKSVTLNMGEFTGQQDELEDMTKKAMALAKAFDADVNTATAAAGQLVKTGMAKDFDEAMDLIATGMSSVANKSDDLLDTMNEYSTQFRRLGLDGETAMGLISQGLEAGARDADAVADAIGIFGEMALAGGDQVNAAFESIGLNGTKIGQMMRAGGDEATQALQDTMDALRGTDDATVRLTAAQTLFGDLANTQADALWALDPASAAAAGGFDDVAGAADKVVDRLEDSPAMKMEAFKRGVQQNVIDFLGGTVLPAVSDFKDAFQQKMSGLWAQAGEGDREGAERVAAFMGLVAQAVAARIRESAPQAASALASLGQHMAAYVLANPTEVFKIGVIGAAFLVAIAALPLLVAAGLLAAAGTITFTFVQGLVDSLGQHIPRWWTSFTTWVGTKAAQAGNAFDVLGAAIASWFGGLWSRYVSQPVGRQWDSFTDSVGALPGRASAALSGLGSAVAGRARDAFQSMTDAAVDRGSALISYVGGMPASMVSGLASQGYRFYNIGLDFVYGIWDGISAAGGWLWSQVSGFASDYIVDPIKDFLRIGSPSKLAADEIGHWLPPGIAMGVEDNAGVVDQAMRDLVTPATYRPTTPLATGQPSVAPGLLAARPDARWIVELRGGSHAFREFFQETVRLTAGGDVIKFTEG